MRIVFSLFLLLILSGCSAVVHQPTADTPTVVTPTSAPATQPVIEQAQSQVPSQNAPMTDPPAVAELTPLERLSHTEVDCVAKAIYFESRGESTKGQTGVGYIVANRMSDPRFPETACGVVYQGKRIKGKLVKNRCEFGWACDGKKHVIKDAQAFGKAQDLAKLVLLKMAPNPVGKALYFHEAHGKVRGAKYAIQYRIGAHLFYNLVAKT